MFIELQGTYFALKKWSQAPATKRRIGVWQHSNEETEDNDRPFSKDEVERMKAYLRQNAPWAGEGELRPFHWPHPQKQNLVFYTKVWTHLGPTEAKQAIDLGRRI